MTLKHEKIRFRRGEIAGLHSYPSARHEAAHHAHLRRVHGLGRLVTIAAAGAGGIFVLLVALALAIGSFGFSSDRLRDEAQAAISRLTGQPMETRLGPARVSLDQARLVALELKDIEIGRAGEAAPVVKAGLLRFGMQILPLFSGRIELGSAALSDASIDLSAWKGTGGSDWRAAIAGDDGVIDADEALAAVFGQIHAALDGLGSSAASGFDLSDVDVTLPEGLPVRTLHVASAHVARSRKGVLSVEGELSADGHSIAFSGKASRPAAEPAGASFELALTSTPEGEPVKQEDRPDPEGPYFWPGSVKLSVNGDQSAHGGKGEIAARLEVAGAQVKFRHSGTVIAGGKVAATLAAGSNKIEFSRIDVSSGRSRLSFSGAVGPMPRDDDVAQPPLYRFELVSNNSVIAAEDANEPALRVGIRLAGRIDADWSRLIADDIGVLTDQGQVLGSGSLQFAGGETPAVGLAIAVSRLPIGYAKTLWPWFAAPGAREWALANVFGGTIENSRLVLNAPPGALGPDRPLTREEVSGHFEVNGTRFDVTGTIPPVRDAVGIVDFHGTDVEIALKSGAVFMQSGRTLSARDGTFEIPNAHLHPLIGNLDIDIEGKADAVAEIGSYEPIDMDRFVDLPPDALSGHVSGHIRARIPLEREAKAKDLDWRVDLAYEHLSIAQPFEGQTVTDATGTITAQPDSARIEARAKLNDVPAELSLTEPLREGGAREVKVSLQLDDASRDKLFEGLSPILSGPFTVDLDVLGKGRQKVEVDLGKAVLSLPWVGWKKGAGVAAKAHFVLSTEGEVTRLTDFRLDGDGFGATGTLVLDGEGLASARFTHIALNRGDDASATIERKRGGYAIAVKGKSFDARPVIQRFSKALGAGGQGDAEDVGGDLDISVDADIAQATGFHGEELKGLKLVYSGAGTTVGGLRASATTRTGARVTVVDATAGGSRKIEAQAADAGAVLRFLDIYENLYGGTAALSLAGGDDGPLSGQLALRDFAIVNEAKLQSIVNHPPPGSDRSLNQAVRRDMDVTKASFDRGFAKIEKGEGYLSVTDGVVRGPTIGSTFQGTVFDKDGNMAITGTFMPAYGLNRIFGEIPILGQILGNGRDRGLIGITFKLSGKTSEPQLAVNPLSIVAPGIFRSIFEYR